MKNNRQLGINLISSFLSFIISFSISFVLTPYLTEKLGKEVYQFYPLANNFITYMSIITIALNSMAARFITIEVVKKEITNVNKLFTSLLIANVIVCLVLVIPMIFIVIYLQYFLNIPSAALLDVKWLFGLVFISMLIESLGSVYGVSTIATDRIDLNSYKTIIVSISKALFLGVSFVFFAPRLIYVGIAAVLVNLIQFIIQLYYTKKLISYEKIDLKLFDFKVIKELLSSGLWNSLNSLGSTLLVGISLLLTNMYIGDSAGGDLAIVQSLSHVMNTIITLIISVFLPRMFKIYATGDNKLLFNETIFAQKVTGLIGSIPILLLVLFGVDFFNLWVPGQDSQVLYNLLLILLFPLFLQTNMWVFVNVSVAKNTLKLPAICTIIVGVVNIIAIYIGVQFYPNNIYIVSLITSIVSSIFYFVFYPIFTAKILNDSPFLLYNNILKSFLAAGIIIIVFGYVKKHLLITSWWLFFGYGAIFCVLILIVYTLLFLPFKDIKNIILRNSFTG